SREPIKQFHTKAQGKIQRHKEEVFLCAFVSSFVPLCETLSYKSNGLRVVSVGAFHPRSFSFHCGSVSRRNLLTSSIRVRYAGWISSKNCRCPSVGAKFVSSEKKRLPISSATWSRPGNPSPSLRAASLSCNVSTSLM